MNASYFLLGSVTLYATRENAIQLLNICMYLALPYSDFCAEGDGGICFRIRRSELSRLKREASARGIAFEVKKYSGLPSILFSHRQRYGLALGIVCAVLLIFFSNNFIWDIRVKGNESITTGEILNLLERYDFKVGTSIGKTNTDVLENRILREQPSLSWISINIMGNIAEVEVIESKKEHPQYTGTNPANIVAKKGGTVEYLLLYRGNAQVMAGQNVGAGDLLISGLFDSNFDGFRYTRADGEVMARTVNEFFIEIPYEYEERVYAEKTKYDQYLNFFGLSVKVFKNYGNLSPKYDTIIMERNVTFGDGTSLPLGITRVLYSEYETATARRTKEEAEELAYYELSEQIYAAVGDAQIIKKTVVPTVCEDKLTLNCTLICIENIAMQVEFEVD